MRRRSPSYSPPPRRGRGRSRSPSPRSRYPSRREPPTSLLVRNLPKSCRAEDLRNSFRRFGPLRDVYLPNDYYTREPRGFGFVQFLDPVDAEDAQYYMNHQILFGREITVVFAQENRKKPAEMRIKERQRGRGFSHDSGRNFHSSGRSRSRSVSRTPPKGHQYSRSPSPYDRKMHGYSPEPESPIRSSADGDHQKIRRSDGHGTKSGSPRQQESHIGSKRSAREKSTSLSPKFHDAHDDQRRSRGRSHSPVQRSPSAMHQLRNGRRDHSGESDREQLSPSHEAKSRSPSP